MNSYKCGYAGVITVVIGCLLPIVSYERQNIVLGNGNLHHMRIF